MATVVKKTVKASGGDYSYINAAIDYFQANYANFITADIIGEIEISGAWDADDTVGIDISGLTTDATRYLYIHAVGDARHNGKWKTDAHICGRAAGNNITINSVQYLVLEGLQVRLVDANSASGISVAGTFNSGDNKIVVKDCLLKGPGTGNNAYYGLYNKIANCNVYAINTAIWGVGNDGVKDSRCLSTNYADTTYLYNCVMIGGKYAIRCAGGATVIAKNTYAGGSYTEDFSMGSGTLTKVNCASEDQSADDTGTGETESNCLISVPLSIDNFVNVTAGSEDFHLVSGSDLIGAGVDVSGETSPLDVPYDIDGDARTAVGPDIGIDEYIEAGGETHSGTVLGSGAGVLTVSCNKNGLGSVAEPTAEAHIIDVQVSAGGDDGYRATGSNGFNADGDTTASGYNSTASWLHAHSFFRFLGISIPIDAEIKEAYLQVYSYAYQSDSPQLKIYGVDEENPAAPTSAAEFDADPLTDATVDWDDPWNPINAWYTSPSIIAIVEELLASHTISNSALMFQLKDDGSPDPAYSDARTYDSDPAYAAKLHIEYTTPSGGTGIVEASVEKDALAAGQSEGTGTLTSLGQKFGAIASAVTEVGDVVSQASKSVSDLTVVVGEESAFSETAKKTALNTSQSEGKGLSSAEIRKDAIGESELSLPGVTSAEGTKEAAQGSEAEAVGGDVLSGQKATAQTSEVVAAGMENLGCQKQALGQAALAAIGAEILASRKQASDIADLNAAGSEELSSHKEALLSAESGASGESESAGQKGSSLSAEATAAGAESLTGQKESSSPAVMSAIGTDILASQKRASAVAEMSAEGEGGSKGQKDVLLGVASEASGASESEGQKEALKSAEASAAGTENLEGHKEASGDILALAAGIGTLGCSKASYDLAAVMAAGEEVLTGRKAAMMSAAVLAQSIEAVAGFKTAFSLLLLSATGNLELHGRKDSFDFVLLSATGEVLAGGTTAIPHYALATAVGLQTVLGTKSAFINAQALAEDLLITQHRKASGSLVQISEAAALNLLSCKVGLDSVAASGAARAQMIGMKGAQGRPVMDLAGAMLVYGIKASQASLIIPAAEMLAVSETCARYGVSLVVAQGTVSTIGERDKQVSYTVSVTSKGQILLAVKRSSGAPTVVTAVGTVGALGGDFVPVVLLGSSNIGDLVLGLSGAQKTLLGNSNIGDLVSGTSDAQITIVGISTVGRTVNGNSRRI